MALHNGGNHNGIVRASASQATDGSNASVLLTPKSLTDAGVYRVLWYLIGADMNATTDQAFVKNGTFTNWIFLQGQVTNSSGSIASAVGGIYTAASKGGTAIVAASQAYTTVNASNLGQALTRSAAGMGVLSTSLFLSLSTPHGSAATADIYILGVPLS